MTDLASYRRVRDAASAPSVCARCGGEAWIRDELDVHDSRLRPCPSCNKVGVIVSEACHRCDGDGVQKYADGTTYPGERCIRCDGSGLEPPSTVGIHPAEEDPEAPLGFLWRGGSPGEETVDLCPACEGKAVAHAADCVAWRSPFTVLMDDPVPDEELAIPDCPNCGGEGSVLGKDCGLCGGSGKFDRAAARAAALAPVDLEVTSEVVEAEPRKLKATWSLGS